MKRTLFGLGTLALLAATLGSASTADAAVTLGFGYPGRFCHTSTPGAFVQPNGGAGIGNWSSSTQGVDCPFIADGNDTLVADVNRVWLYSNINGVTNCMIGTTTYGGGGSWWIPPTRTRVESTFWRTEWDKFIPPSDTSFVQAIHCTMNQGGTISKYSVKRIFN